MSVMLEFSNVIVRRDSIEDKYPGGWDEWKKNHQFWYDDHLYRTGSMGDNSHIEKELKSYGMVGIHEGSDGRQIWRDYCVIDVGNPISLACGECDWVEIDTECLSVKMAGVPDSEQRYISEKERKWRLRLNPSSHIEALSSGKIETFNIRTFERSDNRKILSSHSAQIMVVDENYEILECHRLMYGDELEFDDGQNIKEGQILASFNPYDQKTISEVSGQVKFEDLVEGKSLKTSYDNATGINIREVISGDALDKLNPQLSIITADGIVKLKPDGSPAIYNLPVGCTISCEEGEYVQPGDVISRISVSDSLHH